MDDDLNEVFGDDSESSEDPKICTECEREFEGEGEKCSACEAEEASEDLE
jgi:hypothetical protein